MGDHDTLFKRAFTVPEHAAGELRSVLPAEVASALDLSRLELLPGSFVDPELRERYTDLLFRAPLASSSRQVYVYFLVEHQSEADPLMPWRALEYQQRIWAAVLREEPGRTTLPPVVTVVVHHGAEPWSAPRQLHELIDGIDELPGLAPFVPEFELLIDDLPAQDDEVLAGRPLRAFPKVTLWLLRDGRSIERFFEHLAAWARELERLVGEADPQDTQVVLRYILRVAGETPFEVVRQRIAQVAPAVEEPMASIEQQLIQRGIEKGVQQGIEKGVQQGIEKGVQQGIETAMRATLARLLRARFGALTSELEQRIERASADELDRCVERVLTAGRPEDVFEP